MRQAIVTKYLGPTNFLGARVKASAQAGSITVDWKDELDANENHERAAQYLKNKLSWNGKLVGGGMPDGRGNCYVIVSSDSVYSTDVEVLDAHTDGK